MSGDQREEAEFEAEVDSIIDAIRTPAVWNGLRLFERLRSDNSFNWIGDFVDFMRRDLDEPRLEKAYITLTIFPPDVPHDPFERLRYMDLTYTNTEMVRSFVKGMVEINQPRVNSTISGDTFPDAVESEFSGFLTSTGYGSNWEIDWLRAVDENAINWITISIGRPWRPWP